MSTPRGPMFDLAPEPLDTKALPSGTPYHVVGTALVLDAVPGGNEFVEVSYPDEFNTNVMQVDYGTQGFGGPFTSYTVDATNVSSLVFLGSGSNNVFIDDIVDKPALFTGVVSNSTVVTGPEYDVVIFHGTGNFAPPSDNTPGTPPDVLYPNL